MKNKTSKCKFDDFIAQAERALRRAGRQVRAEHRALGLPLIVWRNGKVVEIPV